ncbi:MAG: glycosyltransferase family 2 protein [Candidatus Zixiibacteriota bacterium]|nr:MAG: glycosyltransferase family 2 protein [candidate division Zixibacteria bacterium]
MSLTVCIIAHNEEEKLPEVLESVRFADEVIVADCGSRDETNLIARSFGARVFSRPNLANLNINKNFTFDQAKSEWILCLDADEVVPPETAREIQEVIRRKPAQAGFYLPRRNHFFGQWLRHGGQYPDWQLRLFRRGQGRFPEAHIHERLKVEGTVGRLRHPLDHYPYSTPEDIRRKLDFYTAFEAEHLYRTGVRPSPLHALRLLYATPAQRFLRRYLLKGGFLDGRPGLQAALMDVRNFRQRYRKLRTLAAKLAHPAR